MAQRILMAVLVGIMVGVLTYIVGLVVSYAGADSVGVFIQGIAVLVGIVSAVWFYLTGRNPLA